MWRVMHGDKIIPHGLVGLPQIIIELNAVVGAIAELLEDLDEGPLMSGFAVDDHTIHVKDDAFCVYMFQS